MFGLTDNLVPNILISNEIEVKVHGIIDAQQGISNATKHDPQIIVDARPSCWECCPQHVGYGVWYGQANMTNNQYQ